MKFQVRYLVLLLPFSIIDNFGWLWMRSLCKNIQLMLEFPKAQFLVLQFSYYTLMTFLMLLSVIFLSMLMILVCILGVIRLFFCGKNWDWFLNFNLVYETLCSGVVNGLLIWMLEKLIWVNIGATDLKMEESVIEEKVSFNMLGWLCLLNRIGTLTLSLLLKLLPRKLNPWFVLRRFYLLRLLCISIDLQYGHV